MVEKQPKIMEKPLPQILDEMDANTRLAMEAALRSEKAAAISEEAAEKAKEAAIEEAAEMVRVAKAEAIAELRPEIARLDKQHSDLKVEVAGLFPIFGLISSVFIESGEANVVWGRQIREAINKAKMAMGLTP